MNYCQDSFLPFYKLVLEKRVMVVLGSVLGMTMVLRSVLGMTMVLGSVLGMTMVLGSVLGMMVVLDMLQNYIFSYKHDHVNRLLSNLMYNFVSIDYYYFPFFFY